MKIFITRKIPVVAKEILLENRFKVKEFTKNRPITKEELIIHAKNADGIIALLTDKVDRPVIDNLTKCKIIANYAVGFNNIDIDYAKSKKIFVTNTPDVLTDSTAELTFTLILACAKRIPESERFLRDGKFVGWKPQLLLGIELKNKILGIIGAGRIGCEVAKRARAFGMKIIYFNRSKKKEFEIETGAKKVSLNKLLSNADVVSIHLPLDKKTFHLLNQNNLRLLKKNAIIVNTARGEIINENDLVGVLKENKIFSAGFDVYENEPKVNKKLLKLKNVVLLPHIGSSTFEARNAMAELAAKNVVSVLKNNKPITPI
ncbi:MAG: D-glycerate dehydrogenase [Ignavibacteria bacterium]|jgi:glyoxylate reductase